MFYLIARVVCRLVLAFVRQWEVSGRDNMPAHGGVVIVSNHTSYWDPVIVGCSFDRRVSYMGKAELFNKNPVFTWLIRALGSFPIKRGKSDREALKFAINHLKSDGIIGLFSGGWRSTTGDLQGARRGAAMLAAKAGVPILPVGIKGARGWGRVVVKVGKPIDTVFYSDQKVNKETLDDISRVFMNSIEELLK